MHARMILTWFGVLHIFAGLTMCSSLKVCPTLLIGAVAGTSLHALNCIQTREDRPTHTSKQLGSTELVHINKGMLHHLQVHPIFMLQDIMMRRQ
jgi:hypothetical protein